MHFITLNKYREIKLKNIHIGGVYCYRKNNLIIRFIPHQKVISNNNKKAPNYGLIFPKNSYICINIICILLLHA